MDQVEPTALAGGLTTKRIAFGGILLLFLVGILHTPVQWNWLYDTAYLLAAGFLAFERSTFVPGPASVEAQPVRVYVALYLLIESALQTLVALCFPSWRILLFAALTACYARVAQRIFLERGIVVSPELLWKAPARLLTLCLLVLLACLHLPMLVYDMSFDAWSGPMVVSLPGTVHMSAGRTVHIGGLVVIRGVQAAFSRLAALVLAGALCVHLAQLSGYLPAACARRFMQTAAVLVAVWWLLPARGLQSLRQPADVFFAICLALLLAQVFRPFATPAAQPVR